MNRNNHGSVATYVVIALILAAITYIEFAIVEYTFSWLSRGAVMFWLALLSVVKFILVVMFFMHLKEDHKLYTGLFGSGMLMALGTFIGLMLLFTVASTSNFTFTNQSPEQVEVSETANGVEPPASQADNITPPAAADAGDFEVGPEPVVEAGASAADAFDREAAATFYGNNCASCHQLAGAGLPSVFPPLAGHVPEILNAGGRDVLMHTVVFGLAGSIEVDGTTYNGVMPAWPQLNDETIAGILNHISTAWGNEEDLPAGFEFYTPDDVAASRDLGLSAQEVHAEREALGLP